MIAELVVSGCGSWDVIEESMTFPRYAAISRYWLKHPPTHILVAAYLKYKPPSSVGSSTNGFSAANDDPNTVSIDIGTLMRIAPGGVVSLNALSEQA